MTPDWENKEFGVQLYCADCRDVLPTINAAITVTSPPYNTLPLSNKPSGLHGPKGGRGKWMAKASSGYFDYLPELEYQKWLRSIIETCLSICEGLVWVNHKTRYRNRIAILPVRFLPFPIYAEIIWNRRGSIALNCKKYAPSHETILGFGIPHYWDDFLNTCMSVWAITPERSTEHPCPFPIEIPNRLIQSSCRYGEKVLDPFMGIGTTGVSAILLGRKFIGIEKVSKYFEICIKRIEEVIEQRKKVPKLPKRNANDYIH